MGRDHSVVFEIAFKYCIVQQKIYILTIISIYDYLMNMGLFSLKNSVLQYRIFPEVIFIGYNFIICTFNHPQISRKIVYLFF